MEAPAYKANTPQVIAFDTLRSRRFDFDTLSCRFLDELDRKDSTQRGYRSYLAQFSTWMKDNGIERPSRDDLKAYRDHLAESDLAVGTQSQYLRAVVQFFRWATAEGLYPSIASNIHGLKVRQDQHKKDALTPDAVQKIESLIDTSTLDGKRLLAIVRLATVCGLRTVEISRANVSDVETVDGKPFLYIQRKGHDDKDGRVFLFPEVYSALTDYLQARTDDYTTKSPLFVSTSNRSKGKRLSTKSISTMGKAAMVAAGYDSERLTFHSYRHTAATAAFQAGCSLYEVQQAQGHANPATTEIYIHESDSALSEVKVRTAIYDQLHGNGEDVSKRNRAIELIQALESSDLDEAIAYLESLSAM